MADDTTKYDPTDDNDKPLYTGAFAAAMQALRDKLKNVALTGSYNDLTDKPSISAAGTSGSYNDLTDKPNLAAVATSGSYNDLADKPTPLTADEASDLVNGIFT